MRFNIGAFAGGAADGYRSGVKMAADQKTSDLKTQKLQMEVDQARKGIKDLQDYGETASDALNPGTQTVLRADAPADEFGQQKADIVPKPVNPGAMFQKMANQALMRGDMDNHAKFSKRADDIRNAENEGIGDLAKQIYAGAVDPAAAEKSFNARGSTRVVPGSVKWDADAGVLSGIDASTGKLVSISKQNAKQYLTMTGTIKPDEYASAGEGQVFNKRTGEIMGGRRVKPLVVNGAIFEQQTDGDGNTNYAKVAEAPKQPSVIIHQGSGSNGSSLTTPQQRTNEEIDAARQALAGMSREEVMKRTARFTTTGRENPTYDPRLDAQWKQANRRKYGQDEAFDAFSGRPSSGQGPNHQADSIQSRFSADPAMKGMRSGKQTPRGVEVFDASGKLVGHYN